MTGIFQDQVAIVTGGGTGLGAAVARALAGAGARVIVNFSRNAKDAEETARLCRAAGGDAVAVQGDVGDDADCRRIVAQATDRWGGVDILVNNAGQTRRVAHADLEGLSADDFLAIYRTNVVGAYQMIRACAPHMKQAGRGRVINISSAGADMGAGTSVAYAASKAAINTMTKSLARALGPEIRVNAVAPGFMATPWFGDLPEDALQALYEDQRRATLLDRLGTAEDAAGAVLFLAGPAAAHITGIILPVEAGAALGHAPRSIR